MWILVVSEDRSRLEEARRWLSARGHHVVGASDGARALAHLHLHPFDLVALDPESAGRPWTASLGGRWDTFDVPLAVFRETAELLDPLRRSELSPRVREKSARPWPGARDVQLASRLLSVHHVARRS